MDQRRFTGSFDWFGELGEIVPERVAEMNALAQTLSELGLTLPQDFITFQTHSELM